MTFEFDELQYWTHIAAHQQKHIYQEFKLSKDQQSGIYLGSFFAVSAVGSYTLDERIWIDLFKIQMQTIEIKFMK